MADKYYRLVTFLVNICPKPMRELFVDLARSALTGKFYTTLDAYLAQRKPDVMKLMHKKLLRQDQYDLIYPSNGQADVETWDITLLSLLLQNLFQNKISTIIPNITSIRGIRNDLQHISGTAKVTDADFTSIWTKLEIATLGIANYTKGSVYEDEIRKEIEKTKNSVITCIGDVLRLWYSAHIVELKDEMEKLKQKIDEIQTTTTKTKMIVNTASRKRKRQDGTCYKWFNTTPPVEQMRSAFELTLRRYIHDYQCQSTNEMDRILTELHTNHFALVSGFGQSLYLQTTLSAIKKDYDIERCVQVSNASDWVHVDSDEVSLVLFIHPFGKDELSQEKSREMIKLLDDVKQSTQEEEDGDVIDVVIVTDQIVFNAFTGKYSHDLLEHPIRLFHETTESSPAVIDSEITSVDESYNDPFYKNLLVQSIAYYREHNMKYTDENTIQSAETMFRGKKALTICGPRGCGKTTLALHLLKHYQEGNYLVIWEPSDIAHVRFGVTCVVLLEDLCGKYNYDSNVAFKWFRKFDVIYSLVKQGKINVVITCDEDRLKILKKEITEHPLLENVLTLRSIGAVRIKHEPEFAAGYSFATGSSSLTRTHGAFRFTQALAGKSVQIDDEKDKDYRNNVLRICQNPDGTVFVLNSNLNYWHLNCHIIHYDANLQKIGRYGDQEDEQHDEYEFQDARDICCTETGKLVVLNSDSIRVFKVENKLQLQNTVTENRGDRVFSCGDKIVLFAQDFETASLCLYDYHLRIKCKNTYPEFFYNEEELYNCVPLNQGNNILRCTYRWIVSININQKQKKYHMFEDDYKPECMCRCEEDSVLVLGGQTEEERQEDGSMKKRRIWRILQLNNDLDILSDVICHIPDLNDNYHTSMVYDRERHRILLANKTHIHEVLYMKF